MKIQNNSEVEEHVLSKNIPERGTKNKTKGILCLGVEKP